MATSEFIFPFSRGSSKGGKGMKERLGGKGANLCEMAKMGIEVPPGFVISTDVCQEFYASGQKVPDYVWPEVDQALAELERNMGRKFGDAKDPLLVSVRSGAAVSMPGMMDTILNLGLNDEIVVGLAAKYGDRFAYDCYRRLLDMFGDVVLGIEHGLFEKELVAVKAKRNIKFDVEMDGDDLKDLVRRYKDVYTRSGIGFPTAPKDQLRAAVTAVFRSWNVPRAIKYREINKISGLRGTAVSIVSMVYGNLNDRSMTGVCFTRNPSNGIKEFYGEYLTNAQGEDVVAGIRTPKPIIEMSKEFPEIYNQLLATTTLLEKTMKNMQDIEFTVQDGRLFMLQTRDGKRGGHAALKIAVDMVAEGLITTDDAIMMVECDHLKQLLHPQLTDDAYKKDVIGTGLPASPGAGVGQIVFSADRAEEMTAAGKKVIMVRIETCAEDVGGMHAAQGILTARGGMTSHAAVVARGWGKPCVCGASELHVDEHARTLTLHGLVLREGDWLTVNGTTGEIIKGEQKLRRPDMSGDLGKLMAWVDARRTLHVKTNADTPEDARIARENGAEGIGLCRTEHMFFATHERIDKMRRMIICEQLEQKAASAQALADLKPYQVEDFEGLFTAMDGLPVTIRLLDPPLHEFLPHAGKELDELIDRFTKEFSIERHVLVESIELLHEVNPMLGLRGCRLGIVHADITEMQAEAIFEAAVNVTKKGVKTEPQVMIPLVGFPEELESQLSLVRAAAERVFAQRGLKLPYKVGTMIEVPRAALVSDKLAALSDFFSFGTNDLTQMTLGFSRDDAAKFLSYYMKNGLLKRDPFESIDQIGVGELIKMSVQRGRSVKPDLEIGVCGEHGGEPTSVAFFNTCGLNYVSCSPLRVPIARLSAAQSAIKGAVTQSQ